MRVFITGASGFIGQAVAEEFRRSGHGVSGLVRSIEKGDILCRREITPVIGDLNKPETYLPSIQNAQIIVHCAVDYSDQGLKTETTAIDTIMKGVQSSPLSSQTIIYTSGIWVLGNTGNEIVDESSPCRPIESVKWRVDMEERLLKTASRDSRVIIIRPGCVYGGSGSLTGMWFSSAQAGSVEIVGAGLNRWGMIHHHDLAQAYVLACEHELNHTILNVVDEGRYTIQEMALAAANAAGIPGKVHHLSENEALKKYGPMTQGLLIDQQVSNERTKRLLNWRPRHHDFIRDVKTYYAACRS